MGSEEARLEFFTRVLAGGFIISIIVSKTLWLSHRLYPIVPLFHFIPAFPHWLDVSVLGLLVGLLSALIMRPRSKAILISLLIVITLLFIQDVDRMWPSFYEYTILLSLLFASSPLNAARFVVAMIYFWSGVQKLTPRFFSSQFPWLIEPVTRHLHLASGLVLTLGVAAALFEVALGLMLLSKRFRKIGLYDTLLMHLILFVLIGPWRTPWNGSAWTWSLVSAVLAYVLFYRARALSFSDLVRHGSGWVVIVLIGLLPLLDNVGLWPTPLSFNMYTGNVATASIFLDTRLAGHLPLPLPTYLRIKGDTYLLDLDTWSLASFNAGPVAMKRSFETIFKKVCSSDPLGRGELVIVPKNNWFGSPRPVIEECGR